MDDNEWKNQLGELVNFAMDCMGAAVTIIDTNGTLLYYNQHSAKVLDRKPEYIGTDMGAETNNSAFYADTSNYCYTKWHIYILKRHCLNPGH